MMDRFFSSPAMLARLHVGPLGPYMEIFAKLLSKRGYARGTIQRQLRGLTQLSHWLEERGAEVTDLDEGSLVDFEEHAPRSRETLRKLRPVYATLLEHLREIGAVAPFVPAPPISALDFALHDFSRYLAEQRGLELTTITRYRRLIRDFLVECFGSGPIRVGELNAENVRHFILRRARMGGSASASKAGSALRHFLRNLRHSGKTDTDLTAAIPTLATRLAKLPEALEPEQVRQLLASCDLDCAEGRRDYAILLLLARLGLRAGEVVAMELSDLDWRSAELTVRGKGLRYDRLPLLRDVGEALANYLRQDRPVCSSPKVFLRLKAPYRGLAQATSIGSIVHRALQRAGLDPRHKGAHLLRHTLATEMLRQGASLGEIARILRHRHIQSTEIYARVDLDGLRALAQPWPGDLS